MGVLSVGTVPMVALAEGVSDGIETLALSSSQAFSQGKMTAAEDAKGRKLDIPADGIVTVSKGNYVLPTEITPKDSDPVKVYTSRDADKWNATFEYYKADGTSLGNPGDVDGTLTAGKYYVVVTLKDDAAASIKIDFIVEDAADLSKATIFDNSNGANDVTDTTFTYTGKAQEVGVAIDGEVVKSGYTVTYSKKLNADGTTATGADTSDFTDAGTYVANIFEGSTATGNPKAKITFTVNPADLSTASVTVADIKVGDVNYTTDTVETVYVDGNPLTVSSGVVSTVASVTTGQTGKASVIVTPGAGANGNVTGKATVNFNVVEEVVSDVRYNGSISSVVGTDIPVNLADGESFRPERIEVFDSTGKKLDASYYTVSYTDSKGNAVDVSALANPGQYEVHVRVNAEACHFEYGSGDMTFDVVVSNGVVSIDDIVFKFDGKVGTTFAPTYDGTDMLERLETVVHTKWGDDLVAGTDYTVTVHNNDTDEDVEQIVDAGNYTVTLGIPGYNDGGNVCTVEVQPMVVNSVYARGGNVTEYTPKGEPTVYYVSYTGEEIEPSFELGYYTDKDGNCISDTDGAWHALPADSYEVTGYAYSATETGAKTSSDAMKDKGFYTVEFAFDNGNYDVQVDATYNDLNVTDASVAFADVDANAWYAQGVFQAKQLGYVKGISGTNIYSPEASISRADALVIISRMSGFDQAYRPEDYLQENGGFLTRYDDVNPGVYYAKAVAWGTKVGIVSDFDGHFRPDDNVTREEFAAMLANYAKATGEDVSSDGSALAAMPDASEVSGWATASVAWAVENKVMGNGGEVNPTDPISRAEVACMAVNYQPDGANTDVIG